MPALVPTVITNWVSPSLISKTSAEVAVNVTLPSTPACPLIVVKTVAEPLAVAADAAVTTAWSAMTFARYKPVSAPVVATPNASVASLTAWPRVSPIVSVTVPLMPNWALAKKLFWRPTAMSAEIMPADRATTASSAVAFALAVLVAVVCKPAVAASRPVPSAIPSAFWPKMVFWSATISALVWPPISWPAVNALAASIAAWAVAMSVALVAKAAAAETAGAIAASALLKAVNMLL